MALTKEQSIRAEAADKFSEAEALITETASAEDVARANALIEEGNAKVAMADSLKLITERQASLTSVVRNRPVADIVEDDTADEDASVREMAGFETFLRTGNRDAYMREAAPQSTLSPESGGVFIPTGLASGIIDIATKAGPMLNPIVVGVWDSPTGNDFDYPRGDDTNGEAYEVAEATDSPDTDFQFDKVRFGAIEYGTGIVAITSQMKRDGGFPLMPYVQNKFGLRLGRKLNQRLTRGNGTSQPQGLITGLTAEARIMQTAATTGIAWNDLLNAELEIDEAYLDGAIWMLNRTVLQKWRALTSQDGHPVVYQGNYALGAPDTILGRRYVINNNLHDDEVVFGDLLEAYKVRRIGGLSIKTTQELFFRKNMEGVAGFASYDAKVVNPAAAVLVKVKA